MKTDWTATELRQMPRAWVVTTPDEDRAEVEFARNAMEARRLAAGELSNGYGDEHLEVRRAPEFDEWRTIEELRRAQLDTGWWFDCSYGDCGKRVSWDEEHFDADGEPIERGFDPAIRGSSVYCSDWCAGAEAVRHVQRRIDQWELAELALLKLGADVELLSVREWVTTGDTVTFRFPGAKYPARWDHRKCVAQILKDDLEAWHRYRGERNA